MFSRSLKIALVGALFVGLSAAAPTSASVDHSHLTYVTFQHAVMLPGDVQLTPGTYRFEFAASPENRVVRVSSRDLGIVYLMAYTSDVERLDNGLARVRDPAGEAVGGRVRAGRRDGLAERANGVVERGPQGA